MAARLPLVALFVTLWGPAANAPAVEPTVRTIMSHGYSQAIELELGKTRAVLCPQVGGRVLEFSVGGTDAMYFDEAEKKRTPAKPGPITAGRFDYGPELTVAPHPAAWAGAWTAEITKANSAKLTSPAEDAGIQLVREFRLITCDKFVGLSCKQTMLNTSKQTREVCHWGRSFSPGGGICVIPPGRPAQPVPEQVRDVRGQRCHQREGDRRPYPRAGRVP